MLIDEKWIIQQNPSYATKIIVLTMQDPFSPNDVQTMFTDLKLMLYTIPPSLLSKNIVNNQVTFIYNYKHTYWLILFALCM